MQWHMFGVFVIDWSRDILHQRIASCAFKWEAFSLQLSNDVSFPCFVECSVGTVFRWMFNKMNYERQNNRFRWTHATSPSIYHFCTDAGSDDENSLWNSINYKNIIWFALRLVKYTTPKRKLARNKSMGMLLTPLFHKCANLDSLKMHEKSAIRLNKLKFNETKAVDMQLRANIQHISLMVRTHISIWVGIFQKKMSSSARFCIKAAFCFWLKLGQNEIQKKRKYPPKKQQDELEFHKQFKINLTYTFICVYLQNKLFARCDRELFTLMRLLLSCTHFRRKNLLTTFDFCVPWLESNRGIIAWDLFPTKFLSEFKKNRTEQYEYFI